MHSGSRNTHQPKAIGRTSRGEYHRECGVETVGDIAPLVEGLISAMAASAYTDEELFETDSPWRRPSSTRSSMATEVPRAARPWSATM
jgi:hypothetical protein